MTPAIAHDHKYFFFSLVTACGLHATTAPFVRLGDEPGVSLPLLGLIAGDNTISRQ